MTDDPGGRASASGAAGRGEFRAIADQLMRNLEDLRALEERKREQALGSDDFVGLAEEAEVQGRLLFRLTGLQLEMARDAARRRATGELDPDIHLSEVSARPLDRILAAWREAQYRLEISKPGSPEAAEAADNLERLREEYRIVAASQAEQANDLGHRPSQPPRGSEETGRPDG